MAFHQERLEKIFSRELADVLKTEVKNNLLTFVSITKVTMNKDLSLATIWYTVLGENDEKEATKKALENARGFLRSELASRVQMRKVPELRFKYDESLMYGNHIEEILEKINNK